MGQCEHPDLTGERFCAVYHLTALPGRPPLTEAAALSLAQDICIEQTIEFPQDLVTDPWIRDNIFGRVESLQPQIGHGAARAVTPGGGPLPAQIDRGRGGLSHGHQASDLPGGRPAGGSTRADDGAPTGWEAVISYAVETSGFELPQLLNVLFGNISLKVGIRLVRIELTAGLASALPGPRFGREGLRDLLGVPRRPLLCTALKPMGLSPRELAELAYQLARGGIDLVKDDHGLADQSFCRFEERLERCADAVARANAEVGGHCRYLPNITAPVQMLAERAQRAKDAGAGGLMVSPGLVGFDAMRGLAEDDRLGLPVLSHPALLGSFVSNGHSGISHYALFGQIMRLSGADACITPHAGGRFPFSIDDCRELARGTEAEMGSIRPIFPAPAGGMRIAGVRGMIDFYGNDVILLIGGDLHRLGHDLEQNCQTFLKKVEDWEL